MEEKYGTIRNGFCWMGITLAILCSFTQFFEFAKTISFYLAVGSLSSLFIGVVLLIVIRLNSKSPAGKQ
ncbi:hypothetical protein ACYSNU_16955 [Enterococcus sp. LJL120]